MSCSFRLTAAERIDRTLGAADAAVHLEVGRAGGPVGGWNRRHPPRRHRGASTLVVLTIAAGVVTLGAAGIATGLATGDRRPGLATLGAVGAGPRVRRPLSLNQSGVIAGLGAAPGTVARLGAAFAILLALSQRYAGTWPPVEPYPPSSG